MFLTSAQLLLMLVLMPLHAVALPPPLDAAAEHCSSSSSSSSSRVSAALRCIRHQQRAVGDREPTAGKHLWGCSLWAVAGTDAAGLVR
jgi:hypothetical protein